MKPTVMIIGLGDLGSVVLDLLAREEQFGRIVVASRNGERGRARCNLARLSAIAQGYSPAIRFVTLDINDRETIAEIVRKESPDLILSTATMQTWWLPDLLPSEQAARIKRARFGVWLPVHLTLPLKLMEALRDQAYGGVTLTTPFPDVVNCVLGRLDLAPTCGVGNLDEIVPKIRLLAAKRLEVPMGEVDVLMVAHHALQPFAFGERAKDIPPYFLRIEHNGKDVTEEVRGHALLLAPYPITPGPATHGLTAASTVRLIRAFFSKRGVRTHAPGPQGLPGGYPIIASLEGLRLAAIEGLSLKEAIAINEGSHPFDGIERIEMDGTVIFRSEAAEVLHEELGYDCKRLAPQETEARANELISRFQEYARRYGVDLKR
jgi:hypothetical protein